jgi:hypothetical protein
LQTLPPRYGSGFKSSGFSRVSGNLGYANQAFGLEDIGGAGNTSYSDNVFTNNGAGEVGGIGLIEFGSNVCGTNTTCP